MDENTDRLLEAIVDTLLEIGSPDQTRYLRQKYEPWLKWQMMKRAGREWADKQNSAVKLR